MRVLTFSYRIYGLAVESFTPIPALECVPHSFSTPDLRLLSGDETRWAAIRGKLRSRVRKVLPSCEETNDPEFVLTEYGGEQYFELSYSDDARFVIDGQRKRIWSMLGPGLGAQELAQYFLGPVMGFLLKRRHATCLHASGAILQGQAVAFCGDAGAGKSTLAAALALRNIPILSDDIVPLAEVDQQFYVVPGCPRVCLWPESVTELLGNPEALPKLVESWGKRYLPLNGERGTFADEKRRLGMIYVIAPRVADGTSPRIEPMRPRDALLALVMNTYMNWLLERKERAAEFEELSRVVSQVAVRRIVPHVEVGTVNALADLVLADTEAQISASARDRPTSAE
jgi:energy-coupling factor transporter ATP-binding protein EcfA2